MNPVSDVRKEVVCVGCGKKHYKKGVYDTHQQFLCDECFLKLRKAD